MTVETTIIQGQSWGLGMTLTDDSGNPISVAGAVIVGVLHDAWGNLVQHLSFTLGTGTGSFSTAVQDTSAWPIGRLIGEIEITVNGTAFLPPPFRITVQRDYAS